MTLPIRRFPHFLCPQQHANWWRALSVRDWRQYSIQMFGRSVLEPRLIDWVGDLSYCYSGRVLEPRAADSSLLGLIQRVSEWAGVDFNHCLMNYYRNGQDSMGWHRDDEPELGVNPTVASLSLGCERDFQFRRPGEPTQTIRLGQGELLIMDPPCQRDWQHQLPKRALSKCAVPRINLTFRCIQPSEA